MGRTPNELAEVLTRYQTLLDSVDGIVWEADPDFSFTFVSRQAQKILGYAPERWTENPAFWSNHLHPDDRAWTIAFCKAQTGRLASHSIEYRMIAADGRTVPPRDIVSVEAEAGRPKKLRGLMVDITPLEET